MASSFKTYGELVRMAHEGSLQLPAFQRGWRWKPAKVRNLIDSLRQNYPIGALLFLQGSNDELSPGLFKAHLLLQRTLRPSTSCSTVSRG